MAVDLRALAVSGTLAMLVGGVFATPLLFPAAFADEPASYALDTMNGLFPAPFDPEQFRKYDITADDSVSTEVQHTDVVQKIGFGRRTMVSIVTTASGTYSSDALTSPNVRYPGIDVVARPLEDGGNQSWFATHAFPGGTWVSSGFTVGSFTYYNSRFTPAR
jgi:hypothetical protein